VLPRLLAALAALTIVLVSVPARALSFAELVGLVRSRRNTADVVRTLERARTLPPLTRNGLNILRRAGANKQILNAFVRARVRLDLYNTERRAKVSDFVLLIRIGEPEDVLRRLLTVIDKPPSVSTAEEGLLRKYGASDEFIAEMKKRAPKGLTPEPEVPPEPEPRKPELVTPVTPTPGGVGIGRGAVTSQPSVAEVDLSAHRDHGFRFSSKFSVYADNNHTTVLSPAVGVSQELGAGFNLSAGWAADAVSSASVDIVSNATKHIEEVRNEYRGGLSFTRGDTSAGVTYIYSREPDYRSSVFGGSFKQDFAQRNASLTLAYSINLDDIGRHGDPQFAGHQRVHSANVAFSQILTKRTLGQLSYAFIYHDGFQSSPYRYVPIYGGGPGSPPPITPAGVPQSSPTQSVLETDPMQRVRHSFVLRIAQLLGAETSLQADYRFYFDDWGINSHTIGLMFFWPISPRWLLRVRNRVYAQASDAYFYQPFYTQVRRFVTFDRELSRYINELVGLKLHYLVGRAGPLDSLLFDVKVDGIFTKYFDFPPLDQRAAVVSSIGFSFGF
jgi:hypothetical protein